MGESFPELSEIVPEYRSANPLVRWLFHERLERAFKFAGLDGPQVLKVLDLGCGEGLALKKIQERWPRHELTGIDHNPNLEKIKISGTELKNTDLTAPGALPKEAFERILCLDVLEHIRDLKIPLESIRSSLKPSGLLVISAPAENVFHKTCRFLIKGTFSEKAGPCSSPHFHRAATLRRDIVAAGFKEVRAAALPLPGPLALIWVCAFRKT